MLIVGEPVADEAWLTTSVSAIRRDRRVRVSGAGVSEVLNVPGGDEELPVTIGPIRLTDGRASLRFTALEAPRRYGFDLRQLSVRLVDAEVFADEP